MQTDVEKVYGSEGQHVTQAATQIASFCLKLFDTDTPQAPVENLDSSSEKKTNKNFKQIQPIA